MAARKGRIVDPTKVGDLDSWLSYYKLGYTNVKHGSKGEFLVLDPATMDASNPAKVIEPQKAYDYVNVLRSSTTESTLRAAAEAKREAVISEIDSHVTDAMANYLDAEKRLLAATEAWALAEDASQRSLAALDVGVAQHMLAMADTAYCSALAPHRYIKSESGLARKVLDYTTNDDRVLQYAVHRLINEQTAVADRVVIGAGTA